MEHLCLGRQAWPRFDVATGLEWLETNGLGGWAYGTVPNANTRSYHAMLAASLTPPAERLVLLARLEEAVLIDGIRYPLYANQWASGHTEAAGLTWLHRFALAPFPTWSYCIGDLVIEKRLFMLHGQNTTVVRYTVRRGTGGPVRVELTPLVTCRSIHAVHRRNDWPFAQEQFSAASVSVEPYVGSPRIHLAADSGRYLPGGEWVSDLFYPYELLRGEATVEDLYCPGRFHWSCAGDGELTFAASAEPLDPLDGPGWEQRERERRGQLLWLPDGAGGRVRAEGEVATLALAADQFIAHRASTGRATVIAGYPWFTDWGRDTMIALPGLTLATGRYDLARELLQTFAAYEQNGLIPNHFPEYGEEPLYNTADASLWFFEAVWQYLRHTGDDTFVAGEIYPVLKRIAAAHIRGTDFGIRLAGDGLLRCGDPGVQVTWMDARVDDWVVTPRDGKPVEIQALWYNALQILGALAARYGDSDLARECEARATQAAVGFARFWNPADGSLYDLLKDDGSPDPSVRPNQLFALALSHPLLHGEPARSVVDLAFRQLYTPFGLRSLGPGDPAYTGRYEGSRRERDGAYHQGTVWAWLVGPFVRAYLHAYGRNERTRSHARALVSPLLLHLREFGLGSLAEIFDGDPPHLPRGCVAQAWSVAELLRLLREELL